MNTIKIGNREFQGNLIKGVFHVGGSLYLGGTSITSLPDNLKAESLDLEGCTSLIYPIVHNCGHDKRSIWLRLDDKRRIQIGCGIFTKDEAIRAINRKYVGPDATDYVDKVEECFAMWDKMQVEA